MTKSPEKPLFDTFFSKSLYFVAFFLLIFTLTFSVFYMLDLVPKSLQGDTSSIQSLNGLSVEDENMDKIPERIVVEHLGIDSSVINPLVDDISVLDEDLKKGVVRYPGSGIAGKGSMFLFGHSANIPVKNKAYEALNNLEKIDQGDEIKIYTKSGIFIYRVNKLSLVDASEAFVDIASNRNMLTLSTCNTFGKKEERYVVEADYAGFVSFENSEEV